MEVDSMNLTEKKYLMKRISEIADTKEVELNIEINEKIRGIKSLSDDQKVAIVNRAFSKNVPATQRAAARKQMGDYLGCRDQHSYRTYNKPMIACWEWHGAVDTQKEGQRIREKAQPRREAIFNRATEVRDQIMLGDSDEALKLLEAFTKETF